MSNHFAQEGQVYVCGACGKRSHDRYGEKAIDRGWDASCMLSAVLCYDQSTVAPNGQPRWHPVSH